MSSFSLVKRDRCPLCESGQKVVFVDFPEIPVVQCSKCGFIYSSRIFSDADLSLYYEYNYGSQKHLEGQILNAKINSWVILRYLNRLDIVNILDVGTGYGFLLDEIGRQIKVNAVGIEVSRREATYAQNTLGLNVLNSSLGESRLNTSYYDLVTSFEVIEHVPNPVEFIKEMARYVRICGYLLIMTDNFDSRVSKSLGAGFPKWIPHCHISHFSPVTLTKTIEATKSLSLIKTMSYTPWEILLLNTYYKLRGIKRTPSEAFNLTSTLESEMRGRQRLFLLRKMINKAWTQFTLNDNMDGSLMYFLARRTV